MAKRFIDTDIFKKGFMKGLEAPYKLLWIYIINDCNHAGIYEVEMDIASLRIGCVVEEKKALICFGEKVIPFDGGSKWFMPGFIEFQYGELSERNKAHSGVIRLLEKYGLYEKIDKKDQAPSKPLPSPLQGAKDKDKEMDKEKDKDKEELPREGKFKIAAFNIENHQAFFEAKAMALRLTLSEVTTSFKEFQEVNAEEKFDDITHAKRMFSNWIDKKSRNNERKPPTTTNHGQRQTGSRNFNLK